MLTRRAGSANTCSRNSTALTRLKIAVLAPMATPRMSTAAVVKRQSRPRRRSPCRVSRTSGVPGGRPARVAARFLELLDAAEQPQRLEARSSGHAARL
jgi:hypothetical protein